MDYRLLPAELLSGAAVVAIVFAVTFFLTLMKEVAVSSRDSLRDQFEMFKFLRQAETLFADYNARKLKENA